MGRLNYFSLPTYSVYKYKWSRNTMYCQSMSLSVSPHLPAADETIVVTIAIKTIPFEPGRN
ncbi:hypothetical protein Hanom_Chr03g00240681 [Helianthus anomalus]